MPCNCLSQLNHHHLSAGKNVLKKTKQDEEDADQEQHLRGFFLQTCHVTTAPTTMLSTPHLLPTVAQKTAPMFTYFLMIVLVWDADIIQGPETFVKGTIPF